MSSTNFIFLFTFYSWSLVPNYSIPHTMLFVKPFLGVLFVIIFTKFSLDKCCSVCYHGSSARQGRQRAKDVLGYSRKSSWANMASSSWNSSTESQRKSAPFISA